MDEFQARESEARHSEVRQSEARESVCFDRASWDSSQHQTFGNLSIMPNDQTHPPLSDIKSGLIQNVDFRLQFYSETQKGFSKVNESPVFYIRRHDVCFFQKVENLSIKVVLIS